jgi:hypothetical protein
LNHNWANIPITNPTPEEQNRLEQAIKFIESRPSKVTVKTLIELPSVIIKSLHDDILYHGRFQPPNEIQLHLSSSWPISTIASILIHEINHYHQIRDQHRSIYTQETDTLEIEAQAAEWSFWNDGRPMSIETLNLIKNSYKLQVLQSEIKSGCLTLDDRLHEVSKNIDKYVCTTISMI